MRGLLVSWAARAGNPSGDAAAGIPPGRHGRHGIHGIHGVDGQNGQDGREKGREALHRRAMPLPSLSPAPGSLVHVGSTRQRGGRSVGRSWAKHEHHYAQCGNGRKLEGSQTWPVVRVAFLVVQMHSGVHILPGCLDVDSPRSLSFSLPPLLCYCLSLLPGRPLLLPLPPPPAPAPSPSLFPNSFPSWPWCCIRPAPSLPALPPACHLPRAACRLPPVWLPPEETAEWLILWRV